MEFTLRGNIYNKTRQDVEKAMKGVPSEQINKYYVEVNGNKYPPKQVLAESLGLGRVEFTTMDASSILRRLGFKLYKQ
jgi:5-methylcytosine-specific restriction protein B